MEFKIKSRDWVKNVAIVFLAVLLVLTFFSNTWMNRSLPEVATQMVESGSITAKVRGTGTVTAIGSHQVKAASTREIRAVMVKSGQEVKAGDVLFVLGEGDSEEIEAAQEALRKLELSYQRSAVSSPTSDYRLEEYQIQRAKEKVEEAKKAYKTAQKKAESGSSKDLPLEQRTEAEAAVTAAQSALDEADKAVAAQQVALNTYQQAYDTQVAKEQADLDAANAALSDATANRDTAESNWNSAKTAAEEKKAALDALNDQKAELEAKLDTATEEEKAQIQAEIAALEPQIADARTAYDTAANAQTEARTAVDDARAAADAAQQGVDEVQARIDAAHKPVDEQQQKYDAALAEQKEAREKLEEAQAKLDAINKVIDEILGKDVVSTELAAAKQAYQDAKDAYYTLVYNLEEAKANDAKSQASAAIDLTDISQQIELAKKKLQDLSGGEDNQILSNVSGIVQSVSCSSGDKKAKDEVLCTIEVPDMGYTLSFNVTNDQARRLRVGDEASVSNYYWGQQVKASLSSIEVNPKDAQNSKILTFNLDGDVNAGAELTLSVGSKSATYDIIVPNSAIRSDSNGSFVLVVTAKNSPLGNRYIARRTNVEVLASDDLNSAVTADLSYGDYVITTSNAPIKSGDMVRLADT